MTWGSWGKQLKTTDMVALMHHCISNDITTFDHADIYGGYTTEKDFGIAFAESGIKRTDIQLISKCGIQLIDAHRKTTVKHYNYHKDYIITSAEASLRNLKTDYLDILLLHRPSPLMQPDAISEAIDQLLQQGKIKSFGVSNFTASQTQMLSNKIPISANQIECSLTAPSAMVDGSLDHMMANNIDAMAWSPLGTIFKGDTNQTKRLHQLLDELCETYDASKDQLVLAWLLKHPANIRPVIGTTTAQRITDASKALTIHLDLQDWFKLLEASLGHEVA